MRNLKERIILWHERGLSGNKVAEKLGCSERYAYRVIARYAGNKAAPVDNHGPTSNGNGHAPDFAAILAEVEKLESKAIKIRNAVALLGEAGITG